jgi:DNA-directed RNA polymerase I, II, and III subunit RPABC2
MSSNTVSIPAQSDDMVEEVNIDNIGLDEEERAADSDGGGGASDDDSASKQSTDNDDETGSQTSDDDDETSAASSIAADDEENEGEEGAGVGAGGGGDEEGGGSDDDAAALNKTKKNKKKRSSGKKDAEDDLTLLGVPHGINFDDDVDEDEDNDEDADRDSSEYFQKLGASVSESYIERYHPESMSHNYDEIQTLSRVVRNSAGVIVDDLHRTIPIMTKYEKTRILGQRAKQLNEGAPAFIKIDSTVIDGYLIAVKELEQKKTPFIIRRPLPNGGSEYWRIQDLEIL